jgi:hypothetical protein
MIVSDAYFTKDMPSFWEASDVFATKNL